MRRPGGRLAGVVFSVLAAGSLLLVPRVVAGPPAQADAVHAAQKLFDAGNYSAAITMLRTTVAQSPSPEAYYWLGRSYYEIDDYDNAIANAEKSVSLDPKNSLYHMWLGEADGGKADKDRSFSLAKKVKKEFQEAVSLNPSNVPARRNLEEYCLDAPWIAGGSKDEALDQVNAIAAIDPMQGHLARAVYYREGLKKPDEAETEIRLALNAKPKDANVYFEAADFFQSENKAPELASAIAAGTLVAPNDPRLSYYRGVEAVLANSDLPGGEQNLKSYLASAPQRSDWPSHAAAREWLGRLYEAQGKTTQAAEQYRAALQLEPKRKEAKARLDKLGKS